MAKILQINYYRIMLYSTQFCALGNTIFNASGLSRFGCDSDVIKLNVKANEYTVQFSSCITASSEYVSSYSTRVLSIWYGFHNHYFYVLAKDELQLEHTYI